MKGIIPSEGTPFRSGDREGLANATHESLAEARPPAAPTQQSQMAVTLLLVQQKAYQFGDLCISASYHWTNPALMLFPSTVPVSLRRPNQSFAWRPETTEVTHTFQAAPPLQEQSIPRMPAPEG